MSTTIKPTVGRVVLVFFAPAVSGAMDGYALPTTADTPVPGLIARVHIDGSINVAAFDVDGENLPLMNVRLLQEGDERPTSGCWAEWMPYQIGQAKKVEDREHDAKQLVAAADRASDDRRMRAGILDMALRTPGLNNHHDVLEAAAAYQAHIEGNAAENQQPAPGAAHAGYSTMQPHQQRVVDERAELDDKLTKLNTFIDGARFSALDADEQDRLKQQAATMAMYSDILSERIAAF